MTERQSAPGKSSIQAFPDGPDLKYEAIGAASVHLSPRVSKAHRVLRIPATLSTINGTLCVRGRYYDGPDSAA
ncbi:hypothetical protein PAXRUDRAFT_823178 [Paxillus rubicundulus Ve08.2h10]|uniref:Uncharacterized protein n=1 Tax=Paxillus rubicundulus Ve08.2h10 TaxID=930991 RepID=A0A0D0DKP7_9AGAM|nr:hypothetical protein PAXRUDRAFT_823178 [Paxillus rubicundulus Ve08.2h10]